MLQISIYKLFNNDLKNLNNNQLQIHWNTIGKNQNRISNISQFFKKYPHFNLINYKNNYPELNNFDDIIIMAHFHHNHNKNLSINNSNSINKQTHDSININNFNNI